MPIFGDSLEMHLFPKTVPPVLMEKQERTFYHKEYNIQYVNLEPVCEIDPGCTNEVLCGIKLHNYLDRNENSSLEFCVITVRINKKMMAEKLISREDLERDVVEFYTPSFKSVTPGRHPVYITFDAYSSGVRCSPHHVVFQFKMREQQRIDRTHIQLHFVNRFKNLEAVGQQSQAATNRAKRPREGTKGAERTYDDAFEQARRSTNSRPLASPYGRSVESSYGADNHQHKRPRMDTSSSVYLNGNQNAPRYERGRPDTHWQSNGVPSSSKNQMIANNARYRDDFRNHFHVNLKSTDLQQSGPSSFASEKINRKVYIKPEPEDIDLEMDRRLNVKQEPEEPMLPYDEPSQTNHLHAPFARSAAPSHSTASAFSEDLGTNAVSSAVDAAVTNVQEDQMDSALIDSAIQSVRSIHDQANGDTTSAQSSDQGSINDTAETASASSVPNETNFVLGSRPIKVEDVDANVYEAVRQRMRQGKSTSQPAQVQDNQREPETEVPVQDPLRQAATYSTVLSTTAQPLTASGLSTTSSQETLERAVLHPYQIEQPAQQSQTASSSALPQAANSHLQVSSSDVQQSHSLNSDVQSLSEAVPSTLILTPPTQNVNPRLIAPMPRRALRSCLVSAIQKQREKRNVTFNTQAENDFGETWPIMLEGKGEQI